VESDRPFLVLSGIARPRVIVSRRVLDSLAPEELDVVLRHERAHLRSRDNLKRLCIALAPGSRILERAWARFAEYAADEAAAGDSSNAVALASALVRVARMGNVPGVPATAVPFLGDTDDLSNRVERLMAMRACTEPAGRVWWLGFAAAASLFAFNPAALRLVHSLLEGLTR
jgi:Zn-dependent protease with chaperone function